MLKDVGKMCVNIPRKIKKTLWDSQVETRQTSEELEKIKPHLREALFDLFSFCMTYNQPFIITALMRYLYSTRHEQLKLHW